MRMRYGWKHGIRMQEVEVEKNMMHYVMCI